MNIVYFKNDTWWDERWQFYCYNRCDENGEDILCTPEGSLLSLRDCWLYTLALAKGEEYNGDFQWEHEHLTLKEIQQECIRNGRTVVIFEE